jgi:hypothetical protein
MYKYTSARFYSTSLLSIVAMLVGLVVQRWSAFLKMHDPNPKSLLVEKASKSMKYLFKWVMEAVI